MQTSLDGMGGMACLISTADLWLLDAEGFGAPEPVGTRRRAEPPGTVLTLSRGQGCAGAAAAAAPGAARSAAGISPGSGAPSSSRPVVGFGGASPIGAGEPAFPVPGSGAAGRLESAFSTAAVARVLHGRPRIAGFELPREMRRPGVFPQPFPLGGDFLLRFPEGCGRAYFEARVLYQGLCWLQGLNNSLASVEEAAASDGISVDAALDAIAAGRGHVYQMYSLFASRYHVLLEQRRDPT